MKTLMLFIFSSYLLMVLYAFESSIFAQLRGENRNEVGKNAYHIWPFLGSLRNEFKTSWNLKSITICLIFPTQFWPKICLISGRRSAATNYGVNPLPWIERTLIKKYMFHSYTIYHFILHKLVTSFVLVNIKFWYLQLSK